MIERDLSSPYCAIETFDVHRKSTFPKVTTLDDAFEHAVSTHRNRPCLGTRQLLEEMDEVQPNGKVFKKVIWSRCIINVYCKYAARCKGEMS